MIRLVATDLDGTFWDSSLSPPAEHVAAVHELSDRGVTVLVATSRRPRPTGQRLRAAGLQLPAVLIDGALGIDFRTNERFHEASFVPSMALEILEAFREHGLDPCLYIDDPDFDIAISESPSTCHAHLDRLGAIADTRDLAREVLSTTTFAFSVLGVSELALRPLAKDLEHIHGATVYLFPEPDYGQYGLIVNPTGVSKWSGIVAYCQDHGITPDEVAAVGDGINDVEMLRHAHLSIGVRGGSEKSNAFADTLIDPPGQRGWSEIPNIVFH